jgi:putative oxygen-independent coproporphyrinogen III oxidase
MSLGVYIHFPFCLSHCPYCDFAVEIVERLPHEEYARAVLRELELRADAFAGLGKVRSISFGGGTPSLWEPSCLASVVRAVDDRLGLTADAEISLEANPEGLEPERLAALRGAGIQRLSLGVQSFSAPVLRVLGRRHAAEDADRAVARALEAGFPRVSLDLIYGAPGQEVTGARADAQRAVATGAQHLSAYALTLEELAVDVPMARAWREGRLGVPDGDQQAEMGAAIREVLGASGFERYEISNFARAGARSVHNLGYWTGHPFLGLGVGAFGDDGTVRYGNPRDSASYLGALQEGRLPAGEREEVRSSARFSERVFLGLRLVEGVDLERLARDFGGAPVAALRQRAAPLADLVRGAGSHLALTDRGMDLHSEVAAKLL